MTIAVYNADFFNAEFGLLYAITPPAPRISSEGFVVAADHLAIGDETVFFRIT